MNDPRLIKASELETKKLHPSAGVCDICGAPYLKQLGHTCEVNTETGEIIETPKAKRQTRKGKGANKEAAVKRTRKPKNFDKEGLK